ncbi:glutaminyl-peptide cyclotransferase [Simiduia sp. 21SJ11W-1]|uniref:glutaminyl-peptide cyclotransferase n=1 Tax=Simiduia sp. 21SJ11W-1 TaxID=2909669 RepID=UPI0020A1A713|nr:glutaminyl-peptide cyclotransferase [Simiduia sp. 21SJ11W-1]UTA46597.1 glutaminyl-peptide cyclotransferase [Simiduia sp. 21SJ11W-1]
MPNVLAIALLVMTCVASAAPEKLQYTERGTRAHPNLAFTQGLFIHQAQFWETSGGYGKSFIQRYPLSAGANQTQVRHLPRRDFAEGLALTPNGLWMLTWQQGLAKRLNTEDFAVVGVAHYKGEGWGLTYNGTHLIMSNGSNELAFRNLAFEQTHTLAVTFNEQPLHRLNELEYAHDFIWANVWFEPIIVAIAPATGKVVAYLDLSAIVEKEAALHPRGLAPEATLNGIAFDAARNTLWVTGKNWRNLYELALPKWPASSPGA